MIQGTPGSRTILVPGSTGLEEATEYITTYDLEEFEVAQETYIIQVIHVKGGPDHLGEFVVAKDGETLDTLKVDLDAAQTVSEADEHGEQTTYTIKDALKLLHRKPRDINQGVANQRENAFRDRLEGI